MSLKKKNVLKTKVKGGGIIAAFFFSFPCYAVDLEYKNLVVFDTVSLVIAAENNASPSSMMGHSFLKISGAGRLHAFGYYAVLNTGLLSYLNALIGNQDGIYILSPYRQKAAEYLVVENRALWEFELDLSDDEKSLLKQRVWDLKGKQDKYSFMSYNCNSAIERLLSGVNLGFKRTTAKPFTTPVEYAQFLYKNGKIKAVSYVRPPIQKHQVVKNILKSKPSSRLAIETGYIEFSPVYQDLRTVSDAYSAEMETKLLSVRLDFKDRLRLDRLDLLKLFSVQKEAKYFRIGYENGGLIEAGFGTGFNQNGFSAYILPMLGARESVAFVGAKIGFIGRLSDKAKVITSYEIATDKTVFNAYIGARLTQNSELYVQYKHAQTAETIVGLAWYF